MVTEPRAVLADVMRSERAVAVPGAYDALMARCAEVAGAQVVHVTGAGLSASYGYPDLGLVTMTEVLQRVREICDAVRIPVIADADTGYGNAVNVHRTVRAFEAAGAAGIHIEDQRSPKKCGQLQGKQVETTAEMVAKVRAAVAARRNPDFAIIARTDARELAGVDEVIDRCRAYREAGADAVFPMALESEDEVVAVGEAVEGPKMITATHGGKTPNLGLERFGSLGYRFIVYAMTPTLVVAQAALDAMRAIVRDGGDAAVSDRMMSFRELYALVGIDDYEAWDARFSS